MKAANDQKGGLTMVRDGDMVAVWELKIGAVPFEDAPSSFLFPEQNLGTEESYLEFRKVVAFTFESDNSTSVIQDFVAETPFLEGDKLTGDAIPRKRRQRETRDPGMKSEAHGLMLLEHPESMIS
jgi:hypothetical protein